MTLQELLPDAQQIAVEIFESYDGRTDQQRFFDLIIDPRMRSASQLAIWDECEPHIIRGEE